MRLLLVEDNPGIARELMRRWQGGPWIVRHAADLAAADRALDQGAFDVAVLDLELPDGDGLAWLQRVRDQALPLQVIIVSARAQVSDRVRGLQLADDYITKPFSPDELDARIARLMRRARNAMEHVIAVGPLTLSSDEQSAFVQGSRLELPPREYEVLELLARRSPNLVPKRDIIELLAQVKPDVHEGAAELYVSRLRMRLVGSGVQIKTVRGIGYCLEALGGRVRSGS